MRTKYERGFRFGFGLGVGALALALPLGAQALEFTLGEVTGNFDTTISAGASWRMEDREESLIGIANGGTSRTVNGDDGNLNYDKGDPISAALKATSDLELKYGNVGIFHRLSYFYDFQAKSDDEYFGERGDDRLVSELDFLDAFAYANFKINGRGATARVGKQVVNWGESTFIGNSINSINPVDVAKLRTPGAEIKEGLLPIPMFWGSASVSDSLSFEALWIWAYHETQIDPRGSFFSTTDVASDDSDRIYAGGGRRNDQHGGTLGAAAVSVPVGRNGGRPEGEAQQYGFSARYFAEWLNSTEFGLYYLKYHSRVPLLSTVRGALPGLAALASARVLIEYPENIELYGLSFNTDGPFGVALQGEYSYRPNMPVQVAELDLFAATLLVPGNGYDTGRGVNTLAQAGQPLDGYVRTPFHQAQMTGTKAFGPTLGANQFVMITEAGYTFQELEKDVQFNGPGTSLPSCGNPGSVIALLGNGSCQERVGGGFADRSSWGYRVVTRMDFENALAGAQLSPRLVFAHDVNGVSSTFNQDTKAITAGLGVNYLQRWQADLSYTTFFDGRHYSGTDPVPPGSIPPGQTADFETSANPVEDRDFIAVSISYAF